MMRASVVTVAAIAASVSLGVGGVAIAADSPSHGKPVYRNAPSAPPATKQTTNGCTVADQGSATDSAKPKGLLGVRTNPTGVTAEWLPGSNDKQCNAELTVSSQRTARRLAKEIEASKRAPNGVFCPLDDGTAVRLFFDYSGGRQEYVNVNLSGCSWMTDPGRTSRERSAAFDKTMQQIAPSDWSNDFS